MFPIIDIPAIHHLVEEAVDAGCEEIIIVLSKHQENIKTYFSNHPELEESLSKKDKEHLIEEIHDLMKKAKFHYVYQEKPLGDGHAIVMAQEHIDEEPFLVLFGDDIVDPSISKDLVEVHEIHNAPVIALEEVCMTKISQYGVVKPKSNINGVIDIESVVEKPPQDQAPSNLGIVGKYVCTPEIMDYLKESPQSNDGEIRLSEAFKKFLDDKKQILGYKFTGKRYDIGNKWGLIEATLDYALKREDLCDKLITYMEQTLKNKKK